MLNLWVRFRVRRQWNMSYEAVFVNECNGVVTKGSGVSHECGYSVRVMFGCSVNGVHY